MNKKQNKPENNVTSNVTNSEPESDRIGIPPKPGKPSCTEVIQAQNRLLSSRCANKANSLSCRCSGCESDDRNPVIVSPADAPLLNTAYDGIGGFLTTGADAHWEVGLGDDTGPGSVSSSSWGAAEVVVTPSLVGTGGAWAQSPFLNANWISNASNGGSGNVDAYFRYKFNLGSSVDPATFVLDMDFYADNRVWEIYVNNCKQSQQPNGSNVLPQFPTIPASEQTPGFKETNKVHIRLDNCWQRCENELIVHVKSPGGVMGFLAQNAVAVEQDEKGCDCHCDCAAVKLPDLKPCISVTWGDSPCDCLETDDTEVLCVTVCNCYSNVTFSNLTIGQILVTDMAGNAVANLPDGTPSVQVIPSGPICFGDIGPCQDREHPSCVSRELVLRTRGAVGKNYRLAFNSICYGVSHQFQSEQCFTMKLCQD